MDTFCQAFGGDGTKWVNYCAIGGVLIHGSQTKFELNAFDNCVTLRSNNDFQANDEPFEKKCGGISSASKDIKKLKKKKTPQKMAMG